MRISPYFTDAPKEGQTRSRYLFLVVSLLILAAAVGRRINLPVDYKGEPNSTLVVAVMLVLNQIAFSFRWSTWATVILRVVAFAWLVFAGAYMVHLMYPW